jgi:hypothetical protein
VPSRHESQRRGQARTARDPGEGYLHPSCPLIVAGKQYSSHVAKSFPVVRNACLILRPCELSVTETGRVAPHGPQEETRMTGLLRQDHADRPGRTAAGRDGRCRERDSCAEVRGRDTAGRHDLPPAALPP